MTPSSAQSSRVARPGSTGVSTASTGWPRVAGSPFASPVHALGMGSEQPKRKAVTCPTPSAHKRLEEAHRFWHRCLAGYQDPEEFRVNLNACIQALRNVTFVLQKEKRLISGFEDWYPDWQARMRADPIMQWVLKSRNRIVKEGDLETRSYAIARLVATYHDAAAEVAAGLGRPGKKNQPVAGPAARADGETSAADRSPDANGPEIKKISAPPRYGLDTIIRMIFKSDVPTRIIRQSTLNLERRWVDQALPDHELLDAMAHAFGELRQLLADAHDRCGMEHGIVVGHDDAAVVDTRDLNEGRYPCMVTSRLVRTLSISMEDFSPATGGRAWNVSFDQATAEESRRNYGEAPPPPNDPASPVDWVPQFIEIGTQILLKDKTEHGWFVHYFIGGDRVHSEVLMARHSADKRDLAQRTAELVAMNGFDGVIVTGEAWHAPLALDEDGVAIPPSERPDREEVLIIHAEDATGRVRSVHVPIHRRRGRRTTVGDVVEGSVEEARSYNFLAPTRAVWEAPDAPSP